LLIKDRDLSYFFLWPTAGIEEAAKGHTISVYVGDDVTDWQDEDEAVWLEKEGNGSDLFVMSQKAFWNDGNPDYAKHGYPVPMPIVIADKAAWDWHKAKKEDNIATPRRYGGRFMHNRRWR
jgi:hypothetical protein